MMIRRVIALGAALLIWQICAQMSNSVIVPAPWDCAQAGALELEDGILWSNAQASLMRIAVGYILAATLGVCLGALSGIWGSWGAGVTDILEFLRPIPPIAWVPISILWFGLGNSSAWFVVFLGAFFPIYIQVAHAFSNCPTDYLDVAKSYRASPWQTFWWVRVPAAAPDIAQGLRVGLGIAWTSVIAAELVGVQQGLGDRIQQLRYVADYERMIVCMVVIGILGWMMVFMANQLERHLISWRQ